MRFEALPVTEKDRLREIEGLDVDDRELSSEEDWLTDGVVEEDAPSEAVPEPVAHGRPERVRELVAEGDEELLRLIEIVEDTVELLEAREAEPETEGVDVADCEALRVTVGELVMEREMAPERVNEGDAVVLRDWALDAVYDGEGVVLLEALGEAVSLTDGLPERETVEDAVEDFEMEDEGDVEGLAVSVLDCDDEFVGRGDRVKEGESVGERDSVGDTVPVPEPLGVPVEVLDCEEDLDSDGDAVPDTDTEEQLLTRGEPELVGEMRGELEADGDAVSERDVRLEAVSDTVDSRVAADVAVEVGVFPDVTDVVDEPVLLCVAADVNVRCAVLVLLVLGEAVTEEERVVVELFDGAAEVVLEAVVDDDDVELFVSCVELLCELLALLHTDVVEDVVTLADDDADAVAVAEVRPERDSAVVGVTLELADALNVPEPDAVVVDDALSERTDAVRETETVAVCDVDVEALTLTVDDGERDTMGLGDDERELWPDFDADTEPEEEASREALRVAALPVKDTVLVGVVEAKMVVVGEDVLPSEGLTKEVREGLGERENVPDGEGLREMDGEGVDDSEATGDREAETDTEAQRVAAEEREAVVDADRHTVAVSVRKGVADRAGVVEVDGERDTEAEPDFEIVAVKLPGALAVLVTLRVRVPAAPVLDSEGVAEALAAGERDTEGDPLDEGVGANTVAVKMPVADSVRVIRGLFDAMLALAVTEAVDVELARAEAVVVGDANLTEREANALAEMLTVEVDDFEALAEGDAMLAVGCGDSLGERDAERDLVPETVTVGEKVVVSL